MTAALLLIDRQNDGFPSGAMPRSGRAASKPRAVR